VDNVLGAPEKWAWRSGFHRVAGTDEAGRGALAGPLVAAAVILPRREELMGLEELNDSKLLSPAKRKFLFKSIVENAEAWSFACASPADIDRWGLQKANQVALREALLNLKPPPDLVMVDYYRLPDLNVPQWSLVHGDRLSRSVAAASVLAKVIRDHLMWFWSLLYPRYGFDRNKGYGTKEHLEALAGCGPAPCHRSSFRSVSQTRLPLEGQLGE